MRKNKLLLLLALLMTAATGAWAQTEITTIPNGDFETWTYDGEDMPNYWNSNATSDGSLAAMSGGKQLKRSTDVRPGSSGQYSCSIWSKSTMGVINIGILTSGRIHFGSMSSTNNANYIYSDRDGSNTKNNFTNPCAMPFTGKPTAIKVWVKYVQGGTGYGNYATAKFSATIHGDADYVAYNLAEHDNDDNKALVVASAEQEIAYNNGEWEQITIPFNYTDNDVAPAYILINAYTNAYPGKGKANDYLYIDDIELEYAPEPGIASTYTVTMKDGVKDADKWTVKVGEGQAQALPIDGLTGLGEGDQVTLQYNGRLKVKGVKATSDEKPAEATPALSITSPSVGQVIGSDGKNYAAASVPSGVTKVAMIAYVSGSNGLAIALADEGSLNWETAKSTCEAKTPAFTGGTWKLPSQDDWKQMFSANGGSDESYTGLNTAITTAGGTALPEFGVYWSSTPNGGDRAWLVNLYPGAAEWDYVNVSNVSRVRACLAFTVEQAAKPAATVTTAPTGAAIVGVGKTTELVSGGVADGGTLWYAVTTTNTKPTSTDGFSDAVPTAQTITASGTVYVWYYVKGDDTHSDSEIAGPVSVTVAPASTTLNNTIKAWSAGTYAVPTGGLTYSDAITVSGDVTLTLTDGETLTLNKGISLASGATLTVEGNGTMNINGTNESTASTVAGSTGTLILTSGTLTARGGNGGSVGELSDGSHGGNGGVAINGSVIVSDGTLTARGGNGGSVGDDCYDCTAGKGGDAISGTLTINGGSTSVNNGSNGSIGIDGMNNTAGTGGKAVAGTVTDKR